MDPAQLLIELDGSRALAIGSVGGKAARLDQLASAGLPVPRGLCLTTDAYRMFVAEHNLEPVLMAELGRKATASMRWEELWDAALRLRSVFLSHDLPPAVQKALRAALGKLGHGTTLAVRSSAPREDAEGCSFAGLHESIVGVRGEAQLFDAVRAVWASLWSDAALLYLSELGLDATDSRMAVVVQQVVDASPSGVAFGLDPRDPASGSWIVEAVPGPCGDLVDGSVDPDRWTLEQGSATVRSRRRGQRGPDGQDERSEPGELLVAEDLERLRAVLTRVRERCGFEPDVEWTGRGAQLCVLQARPVTGWEAPADERRRYLGMRPGRRRLRALQRRVVEDLIPRLERQGAAFAAEDLGPLSNHDLAAVIDRRAEALREWREVYERDFIPFAHGLRALGRFYNDLVRPVDPFEFVGLVRGEELRAMERNRELEGAAQLLRESTGLRDEVASLLDRGGNPTLDELRGLPQGGPLARAVEDLLSGSLDVEYAGERLGERRDVLLHHLLELAQPPVPRTTTRPGPPERPRSSRADLEAGLLAAAGSERAEEAREMLAAGRLSWRMRDDDNLLLGRIESQLLRALEQGRERLADAGSARGDGPTRERDAGRIAAALRAPEELEALEFRATPSAPHGEDGARPRQLAGQPASPGIVTGRARHVRTVDDTARFQRGEVLICDAIQPNMTQLVMLACGIVEIRGGMLIHGAIIAREMGIPCVNGVRPEARSIPDGELVTVDGNLGLVTVGAPEFGLETGSPLARP